MSYIAQNISILKRFLLFCPIRYIGFKVTSKIKVKINKNTGREGKNKKKIELLSAQFKSTELRKNCKRILSVQLCFFYFLSD